MTREGRISNLLMQAEKRCDACQECRRGCEGCIIVVEQKGKVVRIAGKTKRIMRIVPEVIKKARQVVVV